jgi:hypothetical protein
VNSQKSLIELAMAIARIDGNVELTHKDLSKVSVMHKNGIKHLDSEENRFIEIDVEDEARSAIGCALTNHTLLDRQFTPTVQRFYEFGRAWSQEAVRSS